MARLKLLLEPFLLFDLAILSLVVQSAVHVGVDEIVVEVVWPDAALLADRRTEREVLGLRLFLFLALPLLIFKLLFAEGH